MTCSQDVNVNILFRILYDSSVLQIIDQNYFKAENMMLLSRCEKEQVNYVTTFVLITENVPAILHVLLKFDAGLIVKWSYAVWKVVATADQNQCV